MASQVVWQYLPQIKRSISWKFGCLLVGYSSLKRRNNGETGLVLCGCLYVTTFQLWVILVLAAISIPKNTFTYIKWVFLLLLFQKFAIYILRIYHFLTNFLLMQMYFHLRKYRSTHLNNSKYNILVWESK